MPKCNTVVQTENDLLGPATQPNSPKIANFGSCQTLKSLRFSGIGKLITT